MFLVEKLADNLDALSSAEFDLVIRAHGQALIQFSTMSLLGFPPLHAGCPKPLLDTPHGFGLRLRYRGFRGTAIDVRECLRDLWDGGHAIRLLADSRSRGRQEHRGENT